jgi:hypothetical protein
MEDRPRAARGTRRRSRLRGPWAYKGRDFPPRRGDRPQAVGVVAVTLQLDRSGHVSPRSGIDGFAVPDVKPDTDR